MKSLLVFILESLIKVEFNYKIKGIEESRQSVHFIKLDLIMNFINEDYNFNNL
jgi:hypothetical protein